MRCRCNHKFTSIHLEEKGGISDTGVCRSSSLSNDLDINLLNLPKSRLTGERRNFLI